ncbi:MAG: endonuclease, partial [Bacteroidales bacterium]|nr:endonuclease [Bacteroidales bacterium]
FLALGILFSFSLLRASAPDGYYQSAYGKSGFTLKSELASIISKNHSVVSYDGLWEAFKSTDARSNGKVWDMYSNCDFTFGDDKCGNYSNECDCYNREHSFPKSWFNDSKPMYSDLFHLYPTDGKVNGMRGNHPFGEVSNPTSTFKNGSKLGKNSTPGYSGTVFEPIDEYKGDFARSYFYMVTRYENQVGNWNSDMLESGNKTRAFKQWAVDLLLKWHRQDPVSDKEIKRNDAVYAKQHNRNPFIDYPELVEKIWGDDNTAFAPEGPDPEDPEDSTTYTTYEIWYEYHDAEGNSWDESGNTLTVKVPDPKKNQAKAGEETVIFDEDFPDVDDTENGNSADEQNTGSRYVAAFNNVFTYGKSGIRLGTSKNAGMVVFKEFNVSGEFTINISGKGWSASENGFTLQCDGCTQAEQTITFTKSKTELSALDEYETLEPITLTANGKAQLTFSAAAKNRVIIDRVKVTSGNGGGIPDDPDDPDDPDNPDLADACKLKVLYPAAGDTVRKAAVTGRVAIVDKDGKEVARYTLKTVELPDTGNYSLWTNFWRGEDDLGEQTTPFVYALPNADDPDEDDPNVGVETLTGAEFRMYPNPTSGDFVLEMTSDDNLVEIFSVKGSLVLRRKHAGSRLETSLPREGVYFVRVTNVYGGSVRRIVVM